MMCSTVLELLVQLSAVRVSEVNQLHVSQCVSCIRKKSVLRTVLSGGNLAMFHAGEGGWFQISEAMTVREFV